MYLTNMARLQEQVKEIEKAENYFNHVFVHDSVMSC